MTTQRHLSQRPGQTMNVTMLSSLPPQKGVTPYTIQLLDALSRFPNISIDALGFSSLYPRRFFPGGDVDNVGANTAVPVPCRRILNWWNPVSWVRAGRLKRGGVLHGQWWSWFLAPAYIAALTTARLHGRRIVVTAHNVHAHEDAPWKQALNRSVLRLADHIIVHSQANRRQLIASGFREERVTVIPFGAHAIALHGSMSREEARAALGWPLDSHIVLLAGHIRPYKGVRVLLEAMKRVRSQVPTARVVIAGQLWHGSRHPRDEARDLGIDDIVIIRAGFVPDEEFGLLFAATDVVVLPYLDFDAQSAAGTLALSAGRALIVSDTGGLPELVRDGRAIVPPGDVAALANILTAVLTDPALRERLDSDAQMMRDELSWNRTAAATVELYERLLQPKRPAHSRQRAA